MSYWLGISKDENLNVSDSELLSKVIYGFTADGFLPIDDYRQANPFIEGGEEFKNLLTSQYADLGVVIVAFSVSVNVDVGTTII